MNIMKSTVLLAGILIAIYIEDYINKAFIISGILLGMSLAFFIPAILHYKLLAKTKLSKAIDIVIMILATLVSIICPCILICNWV